MEHENDDPGSNDRVQVQVSTTTVDGPYTDVGAAISRYDPNAGSGQWQTHTIDLSAFGGQSTVFVALQGIDGGVNSIRAFWVDDVTMSRLGCASSPSPGDGATSVRTDASLGWNAVVDATGYLLYFGTDNPPTNSTNLGNVTSYNPPGNMAESTAHYWKIVPYNSLGSASNCPVWSFTTWSVIRTYPFTQGFDDLTFPPADWTVQSTQSCTWTRVTAGVNPPQTPQSGAGEASLNTFNCNSGESGRLVTPPLDLSGGSYYQITFWMYHDNASSNLHDQVQVQVSTASVDGPYTSVGSPIERYSSTNGWQRHTVDLSAYAGQPLVFVAFQGVAEGGGSIYVDTVVVADFPPAPPACVTAPAPPDGSIGVDRDANISWSASASAAGYKVFFGTDNPPTNIANGRDLGNATAYDPGSVSYDTSHFWRIAPYNVFGEAADCPLWSFTTQANPILVTTFPHTENLDGVTAPALPAGWTVANGAIDNGAQWATATLSTRSTPNAMRISGASAGLDDWFFSPPLQLAGGTTYGIEFYYRAFRSDSMEQMEVFWGTAPSPAGMTGGQVWSRSRFDNTTYARGLSTAIIPATSGVYYIGWHAISAPNQRGGIRVDDISIGYPPSCADTPSPGDGATGVSRNADLSWIAAASASGYKLYFGTDSPPTNLVNGVDLGNATTYDPGSMAYGALHTWQIVPYNMVGEAAGCPAWSFTTLSYDYGTSGDYNFANSTPGAAGSPWGQPTYEWIPEQAHEVTTWTSGNANDGYATVDLASYVGGAGFPFFGTTYSSLYIGSNGLLTFGSPPSTTIYGTDGFPSTTDPDNLIAGAWMNLDLRTDSHLYYGGDATRFVVTYWHAHQYSHKESQESPSYVTFQVILYPSGKIVIQYNQAESSGTTSGSSSIQSDAIIGIENGDGTQGIGYRVDGTGGPMFGSDLALAFTPVGTTAVGLASFGARTGAPAALPSALAAAAAVLTVALGGIAVTRRRTR